MSQSSLFDSNENQTRFSNNILNSKNQKLSTSDIIPLDNEKDLYDALNNILETNILENEKKTQENLLSQNNLLMFCHGDSNNITSNEKEEENSISFSEKIESNFEKFSPLQNKSLLSNINEIISLIDRDDNCNLSKSSIMNISEARPQIPENHDTMKFNGLFFIDFYFKN